MAVSDRRGRAAGPLAAGAALVLTAGLGGTAEAPEPCCFTNERFAGVCRVVPGSDETCEDVLAYLNTPNSTGKTYCGTTDLRGGWKRVSCSAPTATPAAGASGDAGAGAPAGGRAAAGASMDRQGTDRE